MRISTCLMIGALVCAAASTAAVAQPAPNVIYIMLDDLGPGEFSVYDNLQGLGNASRIDTPNINAMAANGMRFTNAHAATSLCAPTRAAVMAGTPTWQTNVRWGFGSASLQSGQQGVGDLMKAAGYNTALMGKGHLGGQVYEIGSDNAAGNGFSNIPNMDLDRPLKDGMRNHGYDYTFNMIAGIQARPYVFWEDDLATITDAHGNSTRIDNANKVAMTQEWTNGFDNGVTEISATGWGATDWKTADVPQIMLNKAVGFMDDSVTNDPTSPFFLHFNSVAGHWPYVKPQGGVIEVDINGDGDFLDAGETHTIDGYDGTGPAPDGLGNEAMQMTSVSDAEVGVLMSYLEQTDDPRNPGGKLIDNTMIIYTSDNGGIGPGYRGTDPDFQEERDKWDVYGHDATGGLRDSKGSIYEGGHRVPYIVQWKGQIEAGAVRDQQISNMDLMGTLAGLTGQSLIDQGQGTHNMLPVFLGERDDSDPVRDHLISEHSSGQGQPRGNVYIVDGWKLLVSRNASTPTILGLFDLNTDPGEATDLASSTDAGIVALRDQMYSDYVGKRNAARLAPVFIGNASSALVDDVVGLGSVQVEGDLDGNGTIGGDLEANNGAVISISSIGGATNGSVSLDATQDISLREGAPTTNWNSQRISVGLTNNEGLSRSAIEFDLTSAGIPIGATVTGVEMVFTVGFGWGPAQSSTPTLEVYPLIGDFDEATATWNESATGVAWTTPGGDWDGGTLLGDATGFNPDTVGGGTQIIVDDASFMADVLANLTDTEYQLLLKYDNASETNGLLDAVWLNSVQNGNPNPRLVFSYTQPAANARVLNVSGDFSSRDGSMVEFDLSSAGVGGTDYDLLAVTGNATLLGGGIDIALDGGFVPQLGDGFDVITSDGLTGAFDNASVTVAALADVNGQAVSLAVLYEDDGGDGNADLDNVRVMATYTGDANGDGAVGPTDLTALKLAWLTSDATWQTGDFNYDGQVGPADLTAQKLNWLVSIPPAPESVPEPASLGLLVLGALAMGRRRR